MTAPRLGIRKWGTLGGPLLALLVLGLAFVGSFFRPTFKNAVAIPLPVYEIEAFSNGHRASLLNLPLGQPGVLPQAPIPVDVDGDLLPDITVAVNLLNVDPRLLNPPKPGSILAPNIEINRLITAPVLGQKNPPLKVQVKLTIADVGGSNPNTILRFGYDTGKGGTAGSIPTYWKATVAGLNTFFNPIDAYIDTDGQDLGLSTGIQDFGLGVIAQPFQGPLSIVGGIESGSTKANLDLRYSPFPNAVQVGYGSDAAGQHATYAHGTLNEVDLDARIALETADQVLDARARFDRLPRAMKVDFGGDSKAGTADFQTFGEGRLPDVGVDVVTTPKPHVANATPLVVNADIEGLPSKMHGEWNIQSGRQGGARQVRGIRRGNRRGRGPGPELPRQPDQVGPVGAGPAAVRQFPDGAQGWRH